MRKQGAYSLFASATRLLSFILITVSLALAMLVVTQRMFTPFHVVISGSMEPQIRTGDAVVMSGLRPSEVKLGQVIIFVDPENGSDYVIHRVVGIDRTGRLPAFKTKGDNNPVRDDWTVSSSQVVGGVFLKVSRFGGFLSFVMTPRGYASCVAIPGMIALSLVFLVSIGELADRRAPGSSWSPAGALPRRSFKPRPTGVSRAG